MKIPVMPLFVTVCLLFQCFPAQAQFLKKFSSTVKEVAKAAVLDEEPTDDSPIANEKGKEAAHKDNKSTATNLEEHGVSVVQAGTASDQRYEYFMEEYSNIETRGNELVATTVVGVMTKEEGLSELGEGSVKDIAYIFKNGKKVKETTVGQLDRQLLFANQRYDFPFSDELSTASDEEYKKYVKTGMASNGLSATISFNGKSYGPFMAVTRFYVDKTRTKFYAIVLADVANAEKMNYSLISSNDKTKDIGLAPDVIFNQNLSHPCLILPAGQEEIELLSKTEDEAKREQLQHQVAKKMLEHPGEGTVVLYTGRILKDIPINQPWIDESGANIFSIKVDGGGNKSPAGLYLNGKKISSDIPSQGQGWCNVDATRWAFTIGNGRDNSGTGLHLVFSDGTDIAGVRHPRQLSVGEKSYLVWLMHDRRQSDKIIFCRKEL